jgi:hypothetical protein
MKKLFVLSLIILASSITAIAQSWELTGIAKQSRSYISLNPDDPMFKKEVAEQTVVISVANENGFAVKGLKPANFQGYIEVCDDSGCRFFDRLNVVSFPNTPNFEEQQPGLYVITFRATGTKNDLGLIFIKVFRSVTPADIAAGGLLQNRQKAQIILGK